MATKLRIADDSEVVGKLVYFPYSPAKCGKIVKDLGLQDAPNPKIKRRMVVVRDLKGNESEVPLSYLNDYEALLLDHQQKAARHQKVVDQLKLI